MVKLVEVQASASSSCGSNASGIGLHAEWPCIQDIENRVGVLRLF